MQKCLDCYVHSSRMDRDRVKLFVRKLEDLSISDYYGLKSPGLTCYLNSVLQVLFMTADFREAVKRRCSKHSASLDQHLGELFCGLERTNAKTHNIIKQLGITDVYEQRDAAEYFEKILCRSSSEASKIFRGELNHETTCCKCNNTNHFRSFFWVLPLSMDTSSRKSYSVLHGLEDFFKVQKVSKENQMFCNSCKKKQDADTKYELIRSPDVLTLLLKRFTFDYRWRGYIKLQCKADVVRTLNLQNCRYDLYAVVHHCGYLTGGHYTADIKSFETGNWYCFNDDTVKSVKQKYELETNSIRSSTAYLLMYRKVGDGRDPKAQRGHSNVQTEDRRDESNPSYSLVSDHRPNTESCRGGDFKGLDGDVISDGVFERNGAGSVRRENNQSKQIAELEGQWWDGWLQKDAEAEGQQQDANNYMCHEKTEKTSDVHLGTNSSRRTFLQNHNSVFEGQILAKITEKLYNITKPDVSYQNPTGNTIKSEQPEVFSNQTEAAAAAGMQDKSMKLREKTYVRDVGYSTLKTRDVYSPVSSAKESSLKRNKMQKQPVVAADNKYQTLKAVRKGEKTVSQTEKRSVKKSETKEPRNPWK